jgi:hypothetical protein
MLLQNLTRKNDHPVMYASKLFNKIYHNYSIIERKGLVMFFVMHKFKHYLLGNEFVFYVDNMALVYLSTNHMFQGAKWLLLFLKYDFIVVYNPSRTHVVVGVM